MTTTSDVPGARDDFAHAARQLRAIDRLLEERRSADQALQAPAASRESRMDAARRAEVLRRAHDVLVARTGAQLGSTGGPARSGRRTTAVIGHRVEWFVGKVSALLEERGVQVLGNTAHGAECLGWAAAEQPDLVLVEDGLAMLSGEELVRELRGLCPDATVAAQVAYSDRAAALVDAGAREVFLRRVPPADVVDGLLALVER